MSSSYASGPPATPTTTTFFPPSSPLGAELHTPPESVRKYSDELRRAMSAGYRAAVKDLTRDRPCMSVSRALDVEYGYDEDPFDVRARALATKDLTPTKRGSAPAAFPPLPPLPPLPALPSFRHLPASPTRQSEHAGPAALGPLDVDNAFGAAHAAQHPSLARDASDMSADIRPGLLHFHRSSHMSFSSFAPSTASAMSRCNTTDSATWSEASFEAVGPDDYDSMYGAGADGVDDDADAAAVFGYPAGERAQPSPLAQMWTPHYAQPSTGYGSPPACAPAYTSAAPFLDRLDRLSIASDATVRASAVPRRPSLLRPHAPRRSSSSRSRPYPDRSREASVELLDAGAPSYDGRTLSENMIMTAGMMSQRGRQGRGSMI